MMSNTANGVDTSSAVGTEISGTLSESGSEGSQPSKSGSEKRARRTAKAINPTPPDHGPPSFDVEAEAEDLLTDKKKLFAVLKKDLLVAYLMEVRAGKDSSANPQHARQSRKQQKELAELLARLTNDSEK